MKARKLFAAAIALAMVAAVIPGFGLTASAAPTRDKVEALELSDWGSLAGEPVFSAPAGPSSNTAVSDVYEGWSAKWTPETLNMNDPNGIVNINIKSDALQIYGPTARAILL